MSDKKISQFPAIVTPDDADVLPVNDVSEGDPSLINKKMTLQQFQTFIGKIDQATGYTLAGGTISKMLTLLEDCTINQNLSTTSAVDFKRSVIHNTDAGNTCLSLENDSFNPYITFLYSAAGGAYPFRINGNSSQFINMTGFRGGNQVLEFEFDGDSSGGVVWYNGWDNSDITFQINGNLKDFAGTNVARLDFSGKTLLGLPATAGKVPPASMRNGQIHFYLDEAGDVLHFQTKDSTGVGQDYQLSIGAGDVTSVFGRNGAVIAVSGDYNTSLVTENTNLYFTDPRALTAVEKINQATGFTIDGGTISKKLTLTEDSTIDQNLQTTAKPTFAGASLTDILDLNDTGTMDSTTGISFFNTNDQYRIGFDDQGGSVGYLRYNVDSDAITKCHVWSAGDVANPINILACLRGDGLFAIGGHTPESRLDSGADIRVAEIATPANPTSGIKIYAKSDDKLYALNQSGVEVELTSAGSVLSVFGRTGTVIAVSGDYNTSLVTENTNLYFTDPRALTAVGKANQATGYTLAGGTISKTLTVIEDSTIDQDLQTTAKPTFAGALLTDRLDVYGSGVMGATTGVSFFSAGSDYRIGFDNPTGAVGYLRYNVDAADAIHCHAWSAGPVANPINVLACLRGDGLFAIGSHTPESRLDSGADIRVGEIATPANPTSGIKIYAKSDNKLYSLNDAGTEIELTGGGTAITDKLTLDHNNAPGVPAAGKGTIFIKTDKDVWQIDDLGNERNLAVDQEDGIINTAIAYAAIPTDTLINVDATLAITIGLDAAILGRQPVTICRAVGTGTTLAIAGVAGTILRGGTASVANSLYASVTYIKMSANEMLQISQNV